MQAYARTYKDSKSADSVWARAEEIRPLLTNTDLQLTQKLGSPFNEARDIMSARQKSLRKAGLVEVAAISHRLQHGLAVGYGFTGIIVAWLAKLNPWGVVFVAFALSALLVGGDQIQISMGLPASVGLVLQGAILLFVLGGNVFTKYRLRITRTAAAKPTTKAPSGQEA